MRTGYKTNSILCMPICNYDGDVIGVAQIINKTNDSQEFSKHDVEVFQRYLTFCGIGLQNAQLFEVSVLEYKRNQVINNSDWRKTCLYWVFFCKYFHDGMSENTLTDYFWTPLSTSVVNLKKQISKITSDLYFEIFKLQLELIFNLKQRIVSYLLIASWISILLHSIKRI